MSTALLAPPKQTSVAIELGSTEWYTNAVADRRTAERLADEIVELSARIQAATYHLLVMLREFDELEGWGGFLSCAHWLNYRTGLSMGAAREKVRVARALPDLPEISEAMRQGRLSYSKVRALTRIATPRNESRLVVFALIATAAQTERMVRSWRRVDRIAEAERDEMRHTSRSVQIYTDEDGMLVIRARLDPETGAVFRRAMDAASDRLYEKAPERTPQGRHPRSDITVTPVAIEHRHADALALVAETALAADLDPGTRGDRYQVVLHVDEPVLKETEADGPGTEGMAMLEDGIDVSAETSRRMSCDCATVEMVHDTDGSILDVGRKTRTISPAMRRALRFRDRSCRFPGCGVTVCEGHHVEHWADGGETKLDNLILLCRRHHRAVHEEGYRVELLPDGETRFKDPRGREVPQVPPPPDIDADSDWELLDYEEPDGVPVHSRTGSATSDSTPLDWSHISSVMYEREEDDLPEPSEASEPYVPARTCGARDEPGPMECPDAASGEPLDAAPVDGSAEHPGPGRHWGADQLLEPDESRSDSGEWDPDEWFEAAETDVPAGTPWQADGAGDRGDGDCDDEWDSPDRFAPVLELLEQKRYVSPEEWRAVCELCCPTQPDVPAGTCGARDPSAPMARGRRVNSS